jgi:hypothetical protein
MTTAFASTLSGGWLASPAGAVPSRRAATCRQSSVRGSLEGSQPVRSRRIAATPMHELRDALLAGARSGGRRFVIGIGADYISGAGGICGATAWRRNCTARLCGSPVDGRRVLDIAAAS